MDLRTDHPATPAARPTRAAAPAPPRASTRRRPTVARRRTPANRLWVDPGVIEVRAAIILVTTTPILAVTVGLRRGPAAILALLADEAAAAGASMRVCATGGPAIRVSRCLPSGTAAS